MPPLTVRLGLILPVLRRWDTRYAARFTAVGVTIRTTVRVNAALKISPSVNSSRYWAVGLGVMLLMLFLLVPFFTLRIG